jgi:hypothetical protein
MNGFYHALIVTGQCHLAKLLEHSPSVTKERQDGQEQRQVDAHTHTPCDPNVFFQLCDNISHKRSLTATV